MHIEFDIEGSKMRYDSGEYYAQKCNSPNILHLILVNDDNADIKKKVALSRSISRYSNLV